MRSALENAISRRDDRLTRTRNLTFLIAGGASVASVALAFVLGSAIPGRASTAGSGTPASSGGNSSSSSRPAAPGGPVSGRPQGKAHHRAGGLKPPAAPPRSSSGSGGAPVVNSGGTH